MKTFSIGARLTAWYSLILAASLGLFGALAYIAISHSMRATVDAELKQRARAVRDIIKEDAPSGVAALQDEFRELVDSEGAGARLRVAYSSGQIVFASPDLQHPMEPEHAEETPRPFSATIQGERFRFFRETAEAGNARYDVEVGASLKAFDRSLEQFRGLLYAAGPIFLILAALGGFWLSKRALAPVDQITQAARSIGARDLSRRLEVPRTGDELERLADTLNEMLARLEAAFQRITQFTADASHELRSPVSVMRTNAEITLRKTRSEHEYREALSKILNETEKVTRMIDHLLLLARADSDSVALQLTRSDLRIALQSACREASVLAEAKHLKFSQSVAGAPVWVQGDFAALERLFTILLDNAVQYTPSGGQIEVRLDTEDGFAVADVHDTGTGIAKEDVEHVFERFYRADRARSRESGGTGLGLAIGRWIAEAHHGEIRVESDPPKGSTFQVRIPLEKTND